MSDPEPPPGGPLAGQTRERPGAFRREVEFDTFYRANYSELVVFLLYLGASLEEAQLFAKDALNAAYALWSRISEPRQWIRRIASKNFLRQYSKIDYHSPIPAPAAPGAKSAQDLVRAHPLLVSVRKLPARQRQVLAWALGEFEPGEIAQELGMDVDTVLTLMRTAKQKTAQPLQSERRETAL